MYDFVIRGATSVASARKAAAETRAADWFAFVNGAVVGALGAAFVAGTITTLSDLVRLIRDLYDREAYATSEVERLRAELAAAEEHLAKVIEARDAAETARVEVEAQGAS